ncbi:uncharacterized protein LOC128312038 [Acinonyx jubatus]|uniref:Uncharacterized protein LOC128312038 n=1 Tax=Acinonyx jubatus TaxID=32536 RepID=A0ABM3NLJ9_ACIJB|nr:uncharacterized protein LOC128312038 [Acinonyx jubatus]
MSRDPGSRSRPLPHPKRPSSSPAKARGWPALPPAPRGPAVPQALHLSRLEPEQPSGAWIRALEPLREDRNKAGTGDGWSTRTGPGSQTAVGKGRGDASEAPPPKPSSLSIQSPGPGMAPGAVADQTPDTAGRRHRITGAGLEVRIGSLDESIRRAGRGHVPWSPLRDLSGYRPHLNNSSDRRPSLDLPGNPAPGGSDDLLCSTEETEATSSSQAGAWESMLAWGQIPSPRAPSTSRVPWL